MKHQKFLRRRLSVILLALLLLTSLCLSSCAFGKADTLMSLGNTTVSVNDYQLLLSRFKGNVSNVQVDGSSALKDEYWNTIVDMDGTTYDEYCSEAILNSLKIYLIAAYLHDEEYNLDLSDTTVESIDTYIEELIDYDADGSKTKFNQILAQYGMNVDLLRKEYLLEAKYDALLDYLYGADGAYLSGELKNTYCREHFVCFKQVHLANFEYVVKTDDEGNPVKDEDGNLTYLDENGDGFADTKSLTKEEIAEKAERAAELVELYSGSDDDEGFEAVIAQESLDVAGQTDFPDGYFLCLDADYSSLDGDLSYLNDFADKLSEMEIGDVAIIETETGYHVIRKYEIEDNAWAEEENEVWFEDYVSLNSLLEEELFNKKCKEYIEKITVFDVALNNAPSIKSCVADYYY